jgi:hypothetical protein
VSEKGFYVPDTERVHAVLHPREAQISRAAMTVSTPNGIAMSPTNAQLKPRSP